MERGTKIENPAQRVRRPRAVDGGLALATLLRELGLTHALIAEKLDTSQHAVDNWCAGSRTSLSNLASLIELLDQMGAAPERLRDMLLDGIVHLGLDEGVADAYLGLRRLPRSNNCYAILVHHRGDESQMYAVRQMHKAIVAANREPVILDCSGKPAVHRLYLEEVIPVLAPAGVIISRPPDDIDLDATAAILARLGIPAVYMGSRPKVLPPSAAFVGATDHKLGYVAGQRVAEGRYETAAVIWYEPLQSDSKRKEDFDRAVSTLAPSTKILHLPVSSVGNYQHMDPKVLVAIQQFLIRNRPQAVFIPSASLALALVDAVFSSPDESIRSFACWTIESEGWATSVLQTFERPTFDVLRTSSQSITEKAVETILRLGESSVHSR